MANNHRRFHWGWIVAALITIVVALFFTVGLQSGSCTDYQADSSAESTCATGPAIGAAAAWVLGIAGAAFVTYALYRAIRGTERPLRDELGSSGHHG